MTAEVVQQDAARSPLAKLELAQRMLAEISTAGDAASVAEYAEAVRVYARQAKLGTKAVNAATAIKLKAERRLAVLVDEGQAAGQIECKGGDRKSQINVRTPDIDPPSTEVATPATLAELGLERQRVAEARLVAEALPDDTAVDRFIAEANSSEKEVSRDRLLKEARAKRKRKDAKRRASGDPGPMPGGTFNLILADPPWTYGEDVADATRRLDTKYPTMSFADLEAMTVPAGKDSVLLMWATSPLLPQQLRVMAAWGFEYRTCAVWVKDRPGLGSWWRQQHEFLLLGARGKPGAPLPENRGPSVLSAPRTEHSAKPDLFHGMAEAMFPHLTARLELFARTPRNGWTVWGNDQAVTS